MISIYLYGLVAMLALSVFAWILSVMHRDVSIVDSIWSLMILVAAYVYAANAPEIGQRMLVLLALVTMWSLRLSLYLTWRNWGEPEDHRYQAIRKKYQPFFAFKSLFLIFGFQAALAWIVSLPLWPALSINEPLSVWDIFAIVLWTVGMYFEVVSDWQLARFKMNPGNKGKVLDTGLWRYTRHPNYFGEFLVWWGFYLFAAGTGAWWSILSPLLMSWLLLKFSGVVMLEETITQRRPGYQEYINRTNAFFPWRPARPAQDNKQSGEQIT